jgi:hypothetical protein
MQQENNKKIQVQTKTEVYEQLEQDVLILNKLFKELNYIVEEQGEYLDFIEDNITISKEDIKIAQTDLITANQIINTGTLSYLSNLKFSSIGAGIGAITLLYNPYLAIGTIIIGGTIGWIFGEKIHTSNLEHNKND